MNRNKSAEENLGGFHFNYLIGFIRIHYKVWKFGVSRGLHVFQICSDFHRRKIRNSVTYWYPRLHFSMTSFDFMGFDVLKVVHDIVNIYGIFLNIYHTSKCCRKNDIVWLNYQKKHFFLLISSLNYFMYSVHILA